MAPDSAFGPLVRVHRRELGLTQDELARRVGCAPITLRKIEADDLRPSVQIAERLAIALGIPNEERQSFVRLGRAERPRPAATVARRERHGDRDGRQEGAGRAVRGYILGPRLGQGGMGIVYRATQLDVARDVAIKIVQPKYADHPEFIRRFEAEAQLIARLEHPHIVPLYDFWREPQAAYLVMRLLRGGSIAQQLDKGPLALAAAQRLIDQIAGALTSAHRAGVIHRDLRPANILLDEEGNAYLTDFGIARDLDAREGLDRATWIVDGGQAAHTSPEQIRSEPVGPQTDVYGLGVLVYELLTGSTPFPGPTPLDTLHQHLTAALPPLAANRAGLPAALDHVIAGATAKNPANRYASVDDFLEDWHRAAAGDVSRARSGRSDHVLVAADNPYKGLRAFSGADADDFFGREALIQQLLIRLGEGGELDRFLAVVGPSGSGKSSVVKAGLVPALRRGGLPGSDKWYVVELTPGPRPFEALAAGLERVAVDPPDNLQATLKESPDGLLHAVELCLPNERDVQLLLVIDQFEEFFTLVEDEGDRARVLASLVKAVLDENSRLRVVVTLRADLTDRPLRYIDFGELLKQRSEFVIPLTPDELERAIVGPADRVGLTLEPGLTAALIRDGVDHPGALPLLQYALTRLFEERAGDVLTQRAFQAMGGTSGAVTQYAEAAFAELDSAAQAAARQMFLRLVTPGDGVDDTRRKVFRHEIESLGPAETSDCMALVLDRFGQARLLSFDRDPVTRAPTVELAHEALLHVWPRLHDWLEESRSDVRMQRSLAQAATEWDANRREPGFLLAGARLAQYEDWLGATPIALTPMERELVDASRMEQRRLLKQDEARRAREVLLQGRTQRVLQALIGVFVVATLIAGGLAWWANVERTNALHQAAARLAQQAESELEFGKADRSVLLALAALEDYPYTARAEHALAQAVTYSRAERLLTGHVGKVLSAVWSPDGQRLASAGEDRTLRIWEAGSGRPLAQIELQQAAQTMAWAPDGQAVYFTAGSRYETHMHRTGVVSIYVWNLKDAVPTALIVQDEAAIAAEYRNNDFYTTNFVTHQSLALSPLGDRLAFIGGDHTVLIEDLRSKSPLTRLAGHSSFVHGVAWSPDGRRLVTTSEDGTAVIWDATTGRVAVTLVGHLDGVIGATWSPDGEALATAGKDGTVRVWKAGTGAEIQRLTIGQGPVYGVAWSPDGSRLATAGSDGDVLVWDLDTGSAAFALRGHSGAVLSLAWSSDGAHLISTGQDGQIYLWKSGADLEARSFAQTDILYAGWMPTGDRIVIGSGSWAGTPVVLDGAARVVDVATGGTLTTFDTGTDTVYAAVPSPNGRYVVTDQGTPDLYVWDLQTGERIATLACHPAGCGAWPAWSPDGRFIANQGFGTGVVYVFDAATGDVVRELSGFPDSTFIVHVAWSPDGKRIAASPQSADGIVRIWDADTGEPVATLEGNTDNVEWVEWSPAGDRLCTASGTAGVDNSIRIWDAGSGRELLRIGQHGDYVLTCRWSPNGQRLLSSSGDNTVRMWDAASGAELLTLEIPSVWYAFGLWSPDGKALLTFSDVTPKVQIWRAWQSTEALIAEAHACCVLRQLTTAERLQYDLPAEP